MRIVLVLIASALMIGGIVLAVLAFKGEVHMDPETRSVASLPDVPASGGRQLRADRGAVLSWRELHWPSGRLRLDVPQDWREQSNDASRLDLHPVDQATFVNVRVSPAPELTPDDFLRAAALHAAGRLAASRITGYKVKTLGRATGVLTFEGSKEDTSQRLTWTAIAPDPKQLITISLGAPSAGFERIEPVLGAILESVRIDSP
jgi:hypothetical protein